MRKEKESGGGRERPNNELQSKKAQRHEADGVKTINVATQAQFNQKEGICE